MHCSERHKVAFVHHMGDRIALNATQNQSTAFDAIPMKGANTLRVVIKFFTQTNFAILEVLALGGNDGVNWNVIGNTNVTNPPVATTFEVTDIPFRMVKLATSAQGVGVATLAVQAYTYSK
jgi:hypothetical protein